MYCYKICPSSICTHSNSYITHTHHIKFEPKNYAQFLYQSFCLKGFSLQSLNEDHPYETIKKNDDHP
jgi:hypothetical protein